MLLKKEIGHFIQIVRIMIYTNKIFKNQERRDIRRKNEAQIEQTEALRKIEAQIEKNKYLKRKETMTENKKYGET